MGGGGATPPLLFTAAAPSPYAAAPPPPSALPAATPQPPRARPAAAAFAGGGTSLRRKRARLAVTPGAADGWAAMDAAADGLATGGLEGSLAAFQGTDLPPFLTAAPAVPPSAHVPSFSALLGSGGRSLGSPASPDFELARALFASPPPVSVPQPRLAAPLPPTVLEHAAPPSQGVRRRNRVSAFFSRKGGARLAPAKGRGAPMAAEDALEVMRRVELGAAELYRQAEAVMAGLAFPEAPPFSPSAFLCVQ